MRDVDALALPAAQDFRLRRADALIEQFRDFAGFEAGFLAGVADQKVL